MLKVDGYRIDIVSVFYADWNFLCVVTSGFRSRRQVGGGRAEQARLSAAARAKNTAPLARNNVYFTLCKTSPSWERRVDPSVFQAGAHFQGIGKNGQGVKKAWRKSLWQIADSLNKGPKSRHTPLV